MILECQGPRYRSIWCGHREECVMHKWGRHDHARRSRCHRWPPTWEHWLGSIQILRRRSATGPSHRLKLWDGDAAASRP